MKRILQMFRRSFVIALSVALIFPPISSVQAAQSKIYSFTSSNAALYDVAGPVSFTDTQAKVAWYNTDWKYRQKITIKKDLVADELTDFPVVIRLGDTSLYRYAKADGSDLVFTSSDGITKLSHELEGPLTAWVKVPKITTTKDTVLYVYYGNPSSVDQSRSADVWSNGYVAVQHLNQPPTSSLRDSSSNSNNATSVGGMDKGSLQDGKIGKALALDGNNDYLNLGKLDNFIGNLDTGSAGASFWVKTSHADSTFIFGTTNNDIDTNIYFYQWDNKQLEWFVRGQDDTHDIIDVTPSTPLDNNQWRQVVVVKNGPSASDMAIYVDGNKLVNDSVVDSGPQTIAATNPVFLGTLDYQGSPLTFFNGLMDEAEFFHANRSDAWIKTAYRNQCNCENFIQIDQTMEQNTNTPTIALKSNNPLSFTHLYSFDTTSSGATFQLSNDAGKTWFFYTNKEWKKTNPKNTAQSNSANEIRSFIDKFPTGGGKLIWKAYLSAGSTLDSVNIGYSSNESSSGNASNQKSISLKDPRIVAINSLFHQVFGKDPTFDQWKFWANRIIRGEKKSVIDLLGALWYAKLHNAQ